MRISDWSSDVCSSDLARNEKRERRPFTGRHAAMILSAFFGVVISVNIVMASFALSTFGGTVVDNSYVASQHYNEWLARADAQDRLGWNKNVTVDENRHVRLTVRNDGAPIEGPRIVATRRPPLGPDRTSTSQNSSN